MEYGSHASLPDHTMGGGGAGNARRLTIYEFQLGKLQGPNTSAGHFFVSLSSCRQGWLDVEVKYIIGFCRSLRMSGE